ncbi:diguanylate cyclase [bacterium]|nr:diguanylate cyclase [bacterium]MBU1989459.1 diguanylate cyclase [bacterium]
MNLSVKNRTLLFVSVVLFIFSVVLLFIIYFQHLQRLNKTEQQYFENTKLLYSKISKKYESFYANKIMDIINTRGIKESLADKNKDKLYEEALEKWNSLRNENFDLTEMHFHMPDGSSFLRMSNPESSGESILKHRGMVQEIHTNKKAVYGFESCRNQLAYRILEPIFFNGKYIGALELSLKSDYILNEMKYYHNLEGALFVEESKSLPKIDKKSRIKIKNYVLEYEPLSHKSIVNNLPANYNFETFLDLKTPDGSSYSIYSFDLKNFHGESISKVLFFKDITKDIEDFKSSMFNFIFLLIVSIIITLLIINFSFNKSIKSLESSHADITRYKNMINENLITSSSDLKGYITDVSDAFCKISGYPRSELIGNPYSIVRHPDISSEFFEKLWESLKYKKTWNGEIKNLNKYGEVYWVHMNIYPKFKDNVLIGYDSIMHDITDKKISEELMITDGLTHIYNRRHFNDIFPRMIQSIKREGGYLSFLILDIDHFKQYNDTYGHQAGDNALIKVAKILEETLHRGDDYCFRLGGEEFGVLYKSANEHDAYLFAQKFRKMIMSLNIKHIHNGPDGVITASFGLVSLKNDEILSDDAMYKMADECLYRAKNEGRNRVVSKTVTLANSQLEQNMF